MDEQANAATRFGIIRRLVAARYRRGETSVIEVTKGRWRA
jgi:hypothetical protein